MRRTRSGSQPYTQLPSPRKRHRLPQHAAVAANSALHMMPQPKLCAAIFGQGAGPGGCVYSGDAHPEQRRAAASSEMLRSILSGAVTAPTSLRAVLEEPGVLSATAAEDSVVSGPHGCRSEPSRRCLRRAPPSTSFTTPTLRRALLRRSGLQRPVHCIVQRAEPKAISSTTTAWAHLLCTMRPRDRAPPTYTLQTSRTLK